MTPHEVCLLLGHDGEVLWSDASESAVSLPDSRARWEALWRLRAQVGEIAHSHPLGPLAFSAEDETTMEAILLALGRPVRFCVVAPEGALRREGGRDTPLAPEPPWVALLRERSGMT